MSKQHVQLPHNASDLEPKDKLVYLSIRRFMNKDTNIAFPSLQTISKISGASIPTIRKIIEKLESLDYFKISKRGRSQQYEFNELKSFEPFSYDFLDKEDISFTAKSYLIATQEFMYKDVEDYGKVSYSDREMENRINMPQTTISKCNRELEQLGYLTVVKPSNTKIYHLTKLGQQIVWAIQDHEDRLVNHEDRLQRLEEAQKLIEKLLEENNRMRKQLNNEEDLVSFSV